MNAITRTQPMPPVLWRAFIDIFAEPGKAIAQLRDNPRWLWLPLALIPLVLGFYWAYYYQFVDFSWMRDQVLARDARIAVMDPEQVAVIKRQMSAAMMRNSSVITSAAVVLLTVVLQAVYLTLVFSLVGNHPLRFKQWTALSSWSQMPALIVPVMGMIGMLSASDTRMMPEALAYTSLNTLLFHLPPGHAWHGMLQWLDLSVFWGFALLMLGVRRWAGCSWLKAAATVLAPYVVIYGIAIAMHY